MPRLTPLILLALAACSDTPDQAKSPVAAPDASLVGLYERAGAGATPDRICMSGKGSDTRFGLVTSGAGPENCTARGRVLRQGSAMTFGIDGAPACTLRATFTTAGVTLAAPAGTECGYYCGDGAAIEPGAFARAGSTEADARGAVDVAGEPLC